jgi:hypothetical protein
MTFTDNEPALTSGGVVALVGAILALLVAFGLNITDQQRQAILAVVVIVAPIAVALLTRPHVTPTIHVDAKVDEHVAQALAASVVGGLGQVPISRLSPVSNEPLPPTVAPPPA